MAEAVVLAALCVLCALLFMSLNSPERTLRQYMEAVKEKDWDKAYSCLDIPASPFLDQSSYEVYMGSAGLDSISDYSIEKTQSGDGSAAYKVRCSGGSGASETLDIQMVKSGGKQLLIFDQWSVSLADELLYDVEFEAAPVLEVSLDGVTLNGADGNEEINSDLVVYTIAELFPGAHTVSVGGGDLAGYVREVELSEEARYVELEFPGLTEECIRTLGGQGADLWGQVLEAAAGAGAAEGLDESVVAALRQDMMSGGDPSGYIAEASLEGIEVTLEDCGYQDGQMTADLRLTAGQDVTQMWAVPFSPYSSYESVQISGTGVFTVRFAYTDGEWKAVSYTAEFSE